MPPIVISTWRFGLAANQPAWDVLKSGGSALDAVIQGVEVVERDPRVRSVGYGGYPNAAGEVEVDAAVVDGRTLGYGAVAGLKRIATPTAVARRVMEKTDHVFLVGEGALQFARAQGFEECEMLTAHGRKAWEAWKRATKGTKGTKGVQLAHGRKAWKRGRAEAPADVHDTIGMIALDQRGDLAAACTTSGAAFKLPGRVGDSPLIGSGLYADNDAGAAVATGRGEEIVRTCGSYAIVEHMRQGKSAQRACEAVVQQLVARVPAAQPHQMAYIALDKRGNWGAAAARSGFFAAVTNNAENHLCESRYFFDRGGIV